MNMITHDFKISTIDTDALSFSKSDGSFIPPEERKALLDELNSLFPEHIKFSDDGYFSRMAVVKIKNYCMLDEDGKLHIKGSSMKSSKIEPRIKQFMLEIVDALIHDKTDKILTIYHTYIREIHNLTDISGYCSKKTITDAVLNPQRSTEQKIQDALNGRPVQMGDKIYVYFTPEGQLKMKEDWTGDHSTAKLAERLFNTLKIFKNVVPIEQFPKYHLKSKKYQLALQEVLHGKTEERS